MITAMIATQFLSSALDLLLEEVLRLEVLLLEEVLLRLEVPVVRALPTVPVRPVTEGVLPVAEDVRPVAEEVRVPFALPATFSAVVAPGMGITWGSLGSLVTASRGGIL